MTLQPHRLDCDILVAGGGPAGVPCAIAAARDYEILGFDGETWNGLVQVEGNYQRLRRRTINGAPPLHALRVTIRTANGLDHARIREIQVYQ